MWSRCTFLVALVGLLLVPWVAQPAETAEPCDSLNQRDIVYLPSGLNPVPVPEERLMHRVFMWFHGPTEYVDTYSLSAVQEPSFDRLPDFNIAFYKKENGQLRLAATHTDVGDQSGGFPAGAHPWYVGVYMATPGADATNEFELALSCT